jgi:hypothetical protein
MALATYKQLLDQLLAAELRVDEAVISLFERLLARIDKEEQKSRPARRES